ncbi:2OG-Fe(II) oxygenase superfamily protein [Hirsutella rhossiliensis]|uniref:2OG-Fe(II) oxygenase superfamily domain-containing protein n=1 Tax=Hirsutella rhossiliensis TaxID=111463 RepID=A0A9P8N647_9HYPO|nr:2OG-Fe(II) oxygenase superfamily domain-containing protein [Hirsutella rhossiliensis]KAH0967464.1 2OG-Fe(II) oxygenase superfamily domain-containing protein [Hirsutella rhossiliensis]
MFSFDVAALPQLTTRKALIAVDFQNDFVGGDGDAALPVSEPQGFVARAVALSEAFRDGVGDVVWVQSCFDQARPADQEPIITSDTAPPPLRPRTSTSSGSSRRRGGAGRTNVPELPPPAEEQGPPDPEAFLSHEEPACVRASSPGVEMAPAIRRAVREGDTVLTKSYYSAFLGTPLLRLLRAKMVMEVFICGSLANVGVYATALDAAGHGMAITVVEDCCGYRAEPRQVKAVRSLIELTGCEFASYQEVLEVIQPKKKNTKSLFKDQTEPSEGEELQEDKGGKTEKKEERSRSREKGETTPKGRANTSPDIVRPMTGLRLVSDSPCPAAAEGSAGSTAQADPPDTPSKRPRPTAVEAPATRSNSHDDDDDDDSERDDAGADMDDTESEGAYVAALAGSSPTPGRDQAEASQPLSQPPTDKTASPSEDAPAAGRRAEVGDSKTAPVADSKPAPPLSDTDEEEEEEEEEEKEEEEKEEKEEVEEEEQGQPQTTTGLCEGDTSVITKLLPPSVEAGIFERLRNEVQWQRMSHQGGEVPRLVAVQGAVSPHDGSAPVYRHPSDEAPPLLPFSPTLLAVRAAVEEQLGHPVNHALIQFYRDGSDYISEHSDKTLDIAKGSYIANVSLGAQRTMVFRTKRPARTPSPSPRRRVQRAALPHNSLCKMGLETNMKWLHAIRADRRADRDKTTPELAYGGARISLTFRRIATFLDRDHAVIWGQGATEKTRAAARPVVNGQGPEAVAMLRAFGAENHASEFDWDAHYGGGFDVLHIRCAPRFFASADDAVVNMRVALMLAEYGIGYARGSMGLAAQNTKAAGADDDATDESPQQAVAGDVAIMLYLESSYGQAKAAADNSPTPSHAELAARFTRFQRALNLRDMFRAHPPASKTAAPRPRLSRAMQRELAAWDVFAAAALVDDGDGFIAGPTMSLADFALWPVLHALVEELGSAAVFDDDGLDRLRRYYDAVAARESAKKVLGGMQAVGKKSP